mgnify:CR=1 FL=1
MRTLWGDDASRQPGQLQEVMLHETAAAWIRFLEKRTLPREPWLETETEFAARLKQIAAAINSKYKVDRLCRALPRRIAELLKRRGERISP